MTEFGLTLSSEEWGPKDLVEMARKAEDAGFDFVSISDHYHPWIEAQGHSPFVWGVLGAIGQATDTLQVGVGVTCPIVRIHPAVVAQAAATASLLLDGRFTFGIGSGENLNEHILGHRWPPADVRLAMLEEALEIMRTLWTGDRLDHRGDFYEVDNAKVYDPPTDDLTVVVSAFGRKAVELAARIGDGLWSSGPDKDLDAVWRDAGGSGPKYGQVNIAYGTDEAECRKRVVEEWPNAGFPGELSQDLPTPAHFDQLADLLTEEQAIGPTPCGPDLDGIVGAVQTYLDAGYDHVY
ncbi:MAG: TIGR03557 family F420-dependent LLM class oxidoreductase, partial [Acidimicrobiales bacterium]